VQLRVIPSLEVVGKFVRHEGEKPPPKKVLKKGLIKNVRINVKKLNITENLVHYF
jgi:hypothetical protein